MTNASRQTENGQSSRVFEELRTNLLRVQGPASAEKLWREILTDDDRQRLGGDLATAYASNRTIGLWMRLRGVSRPRAVIDLAAELGFIGENTKKWLLREINELATTIDETISAAIVSGALVLVENNRTAHWMGERIAIDWNKHAALWNFLWTLCEQAKGGGGVDRTHFGRDVDPNYGAKTKFRLSNTENFPHDLAALIKPAGRGTQKLDLQPERIHMFTVRAVESLSEVY